VRPCAQEPWKGAVAVAALLATCIAVYVAFGNPWFVLLAAVVLLLSVSRFFAVTSYHLTAEAATVRSLWFTDRRPWSDFRASFSDAEGVLLSPSRRATRLAATRGLYLRCNGNHEAVVAFAQRHIARAQGEADAQGTGDAGRS